jgi:hypothetical protein
VRNVFTGPLSSSQEESCPVDFVTDKKNEIKVKDIAVINLVPRHEDVWGSRDVTQRIIDLGNRWR